jgi:hypothetical protein
MTSHRKTIAREIVRKQSDIPSTKESFRICIEVSENEVFVNLNVTSTRRTEIVSVMMIIQL